MNVSHELKSNPRCLCSSGVFVLSGPSPVTVSWHGRPEFKIRVFVVASMGVSFGGTAGFGLRGSACTKSLRKLQGCPNGFEGACARPGDEEKQLRTPTKLRTARTARLLLRMAVILPVHWACVDAQSSRQRRLSATVTQPGPSV